MKNDIVPFSIDQESLLVELEDVGPVLALRMRMLDKTQPTLLTRKEQVAWLLGWYKQEGDKPKAEKTLYKYAQEAAAGFLILKENGKGEK